MGLSAATVSGLILDDISELANLLAQIYFNNCNKEIQYQSRKFINKIKERTHAK